MADKSGMVPLSEIVYSAIADRGENTTHKYEQCLHWAMKAYKEMHYDFLGEIKSVILSMNDYYAVDAPEDMVDWIKVGKKFGDKIIVYNTNNTIALQHNKNGCGDILPNPTGGIGNANPLGWPYGFWFSNLTNEYGEFLGGIFGYGGDHSSLGSFRYNVVARQFQFASDVVKGDIVLEYLSSGVNPNANTLVNRYAEHAIELYIHWNMHKFDKQYGPANGHTAKLEDEYYNECRKARARITGLTMHDIIEASQKYYMMSPKA